MELSVEIMFVIGFVASVAVWLIKYLQKSGTAIPSGWLTTGVYVISGLLAAAFAPISLPAFPVFEELVTFIPAVLAWIGDLLVPLSAFAGFATLIYNALLKKILDGLATSLRKKPVVKKK